MIENNNAPSQDTKLNILNMGTADFAPLIWAIVLIVATQYVYDHGELPIYPFEFTLSPHIWAVIAPLTFAAAIVLQVRILRLLPRMEPKARPIEILVSVIFALIGLCFLIAYFRLLGDL